MKTEENKTKFRNLMQQIVGKVSTKEQREKVNICLDMYATALNPELSQPELKAVKTAEEFFRDKMKEHYNFGESFTLSRCEINAEKAMRWAKEYSDFTNKFSQPKEEEVDPVN